MRIYGWKSKANWHEEFAKKEVTSKSSERMRQRQHCEEVKRAIPPILINGFDKICRDKHEDGDISGCVEDETVLEVEERPL
jgi:hypothetical protein